ncbi:MAG TPA: FHA domain-containing protein [Vicinamibacteria bacterium]|nr:FHA domain-containing protein [Vicinamibacteria bacterium]
MRSAEGATIRFGECELDLERRELRRGGQPCHLTPRAFALLELLVAERPRAVRKADLRTRLWPETYVSNTALAQLVTELRKAIGDEARQGRWIRTVFGYGYAFAGEAENEAEAEEVAEAPKAAPASWLLWRRQVLPLAVGENVVGRGREAQVRIPASEVSRRHARIVVATASTMVEDLGSRNGTFVRGQPVNRATPLADGDEVAFGSELTTYCAPSPSKSTRAIKKRR